MTSPETTCTLFLCGDVMTGRGVDQILPHPCPPRIYEPVARSALEYVALAERANGRIPWPVSHAYVWGVALDELEQRKPAARIINLETSITTSELAAPKGINYRMHPSNVGVLSVAGVDCAVLANNHVLDWGVAGLQETIDTLTNVGIVVAGAGRNDAAAGAPAILQVSDRSRIVVFAFGATDSGVPRDWGAGPAAPGVNWIGDFSASTAARIGESVAAVRRPGDIVIASVHWGSNWGYEVPEEHRRFARELIDRARVDLVHGHSSHHPRAIEVHSGRAILYGCGDFLNDYEGIAGREEYRDDLVLMYFPTLDASSGALVALELVPLLIRNIRLRRPSATDVRWLSETLDRECRALGGRIVERASHLTFEWTA